MVLSFQLALKILVTNWPKLARTLFLWWGCPVCCSEGGRFPDSLEVYYKDQLLAPGRKEDGGFWFYEEDDNTVNFYNIDFIEDVQKDNLRIEFDIDDGIDHGE